MDIIFKTWINGKKNTCIFKDHFKFFKVYQNLITSSPFFVFLPSPLIPCKDTFMDDYDGIYNYNGLKYSPSENFDNF
jgi:hypothetical protein